MRFRPLALALATLAVLGTVAAAGAEEAVRVAMLPLTINSQDPDSGYLSTGLVEMLAARLERNGDIVVVHVDQALEPGQGDAARDAASGTGAGFVVFGSFTQFGSGASLDVRCESITEGAEEAPDLHDARRVFVQAGDLSDIIPKLDELAEKISRHVLGDSGVSVQPAVVAPPAEQERYEKLLRRVEALENKVYKDSLAVVPDMTVSGSVQAANDSPPEAEGAEPAE